MTDVRHREDLRDDPALHGEDLAAAVRLTSAFAHVTMDRPAPVPVMARQRTVAPTRQRPPRRRLLAPAVLAAAAVPVVAVIISQAAVPSSAWAATPAVASGQDRAAVAAACSAGVVSRPDQDPKDPKRMAPSPTALPPLKVLDVRGAGAVAVFADGTWTADCVLTRQGDRWERLSYSLLPTVWGGGPSAVSVAGVGTTSLTGTDAFYANGSTAAGTAAVHLRIPGQQEVVASVAANRFVLWWPQSLNRAGARLIALDDSGRERGTVNIDTLLEAAATKGVPGKDPSLNQKDTPPPAKAKQR